MKKIMSLIVIFGLTVLAACGTNNVIQNGSDESKDQPENEDVNSTYFEGYIAEIEDNRVLITEKKLEQPYSEIDIEEAHEKAGNAVFFSLDEIEADLVSSFIIGEKVKVKHGAIAESYPGQGGAKAIERIVDEEDDLITSLVKDHKNIVQVNRLFNGETIRKVSYTTEGDPIFTIIKNQGGKYELFVDATQDEYGNAESVRTFNCQQLEKVFNDEGQLEIALKECDNEGQQMLVLNAPAIDIVVPEQTYTEVSINVDGEILYESQDANHIQDMINKIKDGKKTSVMVMSLMKPDGTINFKGEKADLTYDYYKSGGLIAHNVFIDAGVNFE
ncbi:DUF3221 domain-containing protein [Filobacillus milosensis]|uniref:DUF3221 domain-containing protein n=1 Tax=Filobacillus milosensis TaxID=94137 RepID=A0A4Y8ILS3_9BACI|nr:DUF3221 domain-containing protein [Filobacillus milosensis]TFB15081.1 DUF3221 domain-containing protein [Filobacillus milosensis]